MLCIYVIENIVSHEKYVGITKRDIKIRFLVMKENNSG